MNVEIRTGTWSSPGDPVEGILVSCRNLSTGHTSTDYTDAYGIATVSMDVWGHTYELSGTFNAPYKCIGCHERFILAGDEEGAITWFATKEDIKPPVPPVTGLRDEEILERDATGNAIKVAGFACAFCPGAPKYAYIPPSGWNVDVCVVLPGVGSHGCCAMCKVVELVLSRILKCNEGTTRNVVYCPDGVTAKSWEECVNGKWTYMIMTCPEKPKDCPAYELLNGETICMERDLWKCENGEMVKIEENSPECKEVEPGNGPACPIACVCMGSPLIDQLGPIREFRDEVLKMSRTGLIFVSLYYGKLSPHLSPILEKSETLRRVGRILVKGLLWMLRK